MLLCVNYHYFRDGGNNKGIYPTTRGQLAKQIDLIGKCYQYVSLEQLKTLDYERENYCLLTFDDGLREQFENAYDVLNCKGIPGAFFISPCVYVDDQVLSVHKLHHLLENVEISAFKFELTQFLTVNGIPLHEDLAIRARLQYRYDDEETAIMKFILNFILEKQLQVRFIDGLFAEFVSDAFRFKQQLYMDTDQVKKLASAGMLGSHGYSHYALDPLENDIIIRELVESKAYLERISGTTLHAISYPFGGPTAVSKRVADYAEHAGYTLGFTMERGLNATNQDRLLLARFDTNDVPGGKRALFESPCELVENNLLRKRYINEYSCR